jgi:tetratricopeptide (TPR) repeat protein
MDADPHDPSVLMVNAGALYNDGDGDLAAALVLARQAYELNPNSAIICNTTGWYEWASGNYDAALACALRGLELSPGAPERFWSFAGIGRTHLSAGRIEEALVWALRAIEANPQFESAWAIAIACYALLGQKQDVQAALADLALAIPGATIDGWLRGASLEQERHMRQGLEKVHALLQPTAAGT